MGRGGVGAISGENLRLAAMEGDIDVTNAQLAGGADVNARSGSGETALYIACSNGHEHVVRALLDARAAVNKVNSSGTLTPLHAACAAGYETIASLLLERGADVHAKTVRGRTTADLAQQFQRTAIFEAMIP